MAKIIWSVAALVILTTQTTYARYGDDRCCGAAAGPPSMAATPMAAVPTYRTAQADGDTGDRRASKRLFDGSDNSVSQSQWPRGPQKRGPRLGLKHTRNPQPPLRGNTLSNAPVAEPPFRGPVRGPQTPVRNPREDGPRIRSEQSLPTLVVRRPGMRRRSA